MSPAERSELIQRAVHYFLEHHPEYNIEDVVRIEQAVVKDEGNRIFQEAIFSWERRQERGLQQGMMLGRREGIQQIAKNMLDEGVEFDTICKWNGLSFDQVKQLQNGLN